MIKPKVFNVYSIPQVLKEQKVDASLTIDEAFNFGDTSSFRVMLQVEPPEVKDLTKTIIDNHKFYDVILAWNTRILQACPNAVLFPLGCCSWIPWNDEGNNPNHARPQNGVPYAECDVSKKQFKASFLTSNKAWTPGHIIRQQVYEALPNSVGSLTVDKHRSPPWIADKRDFLEPYQFTVSPLNASHDNWFDDKMIDPLIAKTIPLIWGFPNLENYFNVDGIIRFDSVAELMEKLSLLTPEYYAQHFDAVMDNFHRALEYVHVWSRVDREMSKGIDRKFLQTGSHDSVDQRRPRFLRGRNS